MGRARVTPHPSAGTPYFARWSRRRASQTTIAPPAIEPAQQPQAKAAEVLPTSTPELYKAAGGCVALEVTATELDESWSAGAGEG
jgi:hypothetical protein